MARYRFGDSEQLTCLPGIKRFNINVGTGESNVCYAAKIKTSTFILPWRTSVDNYVLAENASTYYEINKEDIDYYQSIDVMPTNIPLYQISTPELLFGHSLWLALLSLVIWKGIEYMRDKPAKGGQGLEPENS